MFCFNCSSEIADGATFCKNCGNRLFEQKSKAPIMFVSLSAALVLVTILGFGILVALSALFLEHGLRGPEFAMPVFMLIMTIFGIDFMLLRQLSFLMKAEVHSKPRMQPESYQPPKNAAQATPMLQEYRQPVNSVVDGNTTRNFEEVPADPRRTNTL